MRSRTVREGSVGLLILLGLGVFGGLILWLRGFSPGKRSYYATVQFPDAGGMQVGDVVRYRGVVAGKINAIHLSANAANVDIKITPATLVIPKKVSIQVSQSGLVGASYIDIIPTADLPDQATSANPLAADCDKALVICDGDRLQGEPGISLNALLGSFARFTDVYSSPEFVAETRTLTRNVAGAASGVNVLANEVTGLTRSVRQELGTLSRSANASTNSLGRAANDVSLTVTEVRELVAANRTSLIGTLDNINQTSQQLRTIVSSLSPTLETIGRGDFAQNLQTLSANAAEASTNLRDLTSAVGSSDNVLLLQQTLDSARATFQNAQKITSDLDELTGDPAFRQNVRRLVNGLGGLVSSTEQLQQQASLAQVLNSTSKTGNLQAIPIAEQKAIGTKPSAVPPVAQPDLPQGHTPSAELAQPAGTNSTRNLPSHTAQSETLPAQESN
jgi:phospholipid/cholesterol/gamma-HCH transport system substrate-binding protein